jgi:ABC-2 type transport system ATP-binding protein
LGWIEISNLSKSYGKREVIHGLNLNIEKGINLIRGENGAGKSTLISIIEGLTKFNSGKVSILGFDPRKDSKEIMKHISFIPETPVFYGSQMIQEFLSIYTNINGGSKELVKYYMETFGISEIAGSHFQSLSKGEAQLVQIVASLSTQKEFYVMDEPNSNIDVDGRSKLAREIEKIRNKDGSGFLIVTHIIDDIYPIADRTYLMHSGSIKLISDTGNGNSGNKIYTVAIMTSDLEGIMKSLSQFNPVQSGQEIILKGVDVYSIIGHLSEKQVKSIMSIRKFTEMPS